MTVQDIIHDGAVELHRIQAAQYHLRDWRQRAAQGWRHRARWARMQATYNAEWGLHAVWCDEQADRLEAAA